MDDFLTYSQLPSAPVRNCITLLGVAKIAPDDLRWEHLTAQEPRLLDLLQEIQYTKQKYGKKFKALDAWYGYRDWQGCSFKEKLCQLVGWESKVKNGMLETAKAYDIAYDYLLSVVEKRQAKL